MSFEAGQFASDYEILSILGKGGMGRVYQVRNVISNRIEAMKVLLEDVASEPELGDRFLGEIRTLARLEHPNIAKFHTAFKVENQLVMVMEYVEGVTLSDRNKQGNLAQEEVLSYVGQTLEALSFAHKNGVIHRDIKPANLMITPHGVVKLMDFGIAKSNIDPLLTRPGTTMGSMLYMSPEQVRGGSVDARSDIYSVGVLLYELTAGRRPFEGENTFGILDAQLNKAPTPPIEVNASLPQALNDIILTALNKDPMQRFQTADAFKNALESLRQRAAPPKAVAAAAVPPPPQPVPISAKSSRGLWMALGAAACVAVLVAGAMTLPHFFKSAAATGAKPQAIQTAVPAEVPATPPVSEPVVSQPIPAAAPAIQSPAVRTNTPAPAAQPEVKQQKRAVSKLPDPPAAVVRQPAQYPAPQAVEAQPVGPSQQELEAADEEVMKLRVRADSVKSSLDDLRSQQGAQGLGLRQDMSSAASRMDSYLGAAQRALQAGNLESARKNAERAEQEITKLEAFFGK